MLENQDCVSCQGTGISRRGQSGCAVCFGTGEIEHPEARKERLALLAEWRSDSSEVAF